MDTGYGTIIMKRHDDNTVEIVHADEIVGVSTQMLASQPLMLGTDGCVDDCGYLVFDPAGEYRYRPLRFAENGHVVVCVRVP